MKDYLKIIKAQLRLELPDEPPYGAKVIVEDGELLKKAKNLHTSIYVQKGFVSVDEIDQDGKISLKSDPHQNHSDYFAIVDKTSGNVLATARQIKAIGGHHDLPIMDKAKLRRRHKKKLSKKPHEKMIEISGLAKDTGVASAAVIELYKAMWLHSEKQGHNYWLMACDVKLYPKLRVLFGRSIHRIGRRTKYKGGDVIPCVLDLTSARKVLNKNKKSRHPVYKNIRRKVADHFMSPMIWL